MQLFRRAPGSQVSDDFGAKNYVVQLSLFKNSYYYYYYYRRGSRCRTAGRHIQLFKLSNVKCASCTAVCQVRI